MAAREIATLLLLFKTYPEIPPLTGALTISAQKDNNVPTFLARHWMRLALHAHMYKHEDLSTNHTHSTASE